MQCFKDAAINSVLAPVAEKVIKHLPGTEAFRQIADVLSITEETARWRVFKARQKLLDRLYPGEGRP